MPQEGLFSEVKSDKERELFFKALFKEKSVLECRGKVSGTFICMPLERKGDSLLVRPVAIDYSTMTIGDQSLIVSFSAREELLFFKSELQSTPLGYVLSIREPLFQLKRRDIYRIRFPSDYSARLLVEDVDGQELQVEYDLLNFNSGGFAFSIRGLAADIFKPAAEIHGEFEIGSFLKFKFQGRIRHQTPLLDEPGHAAIGVELLGLSQKEKEKLISTVMRVHRDLF